MMIETPTAVTVPLTRDAQGAIRVGNTRVLLEVVIEAYQRGDTPEQIVQGFPTLKLADIYAVIAYYLAHQDEVDVYIQQVDEQGAEIRRQFEALNPSPLKRDTVEASF